MKKKFPPHIKKYPYFCTLKRDNIYNKLNTFIMKKALLFLAAALTFGMAANAQSPFSEDFNNVADGNIPAGWTTYGDNLTNHYTSTPP